MTSNSRKYLGVLKTDRGLPADVPHPLQNIPGSLLDADAIGHPIISETVAGASPSVAVRGDARLEPAFIAAAQRLVERGAIAITSTCGFFIRHQAALAASVPVPVATSSLLLLPVLLRQFPSPAKIAVLTFDSKHCTDDLLGLENAIDRTRIVISGVEGGKFWHDEMQDPPRAIDPRAVEGDVAGCVSKLQAEHPDIAAILFECAGFPSAAPAIRKATGLPVYDITTLARMTLASVA